MNGYGLDWVGLLIMGRYLNITDSFNCLDDSICRDNRGRLFNPGQSSTWNYVGNYELGLDPHLGFSGIANYGYDNVNFDDQVIVPDQIVGVINTTEFWLGFLGLGIEETNFTDVNKQTFLTTLADQTRIPSRSYGYTAGASYREFIDHIPYFPRLDND